VTWINVPAIEMLEVRSLAELGASDKVAATESNPGTAA